MHMFLKKTHMNGLIRRNGSSQLGFFQRRILPINELMRPVERIRETVSWTSYRDMIVKPRPPSEWKNGECRKGLVKSSGKSKHFGRSITNSSPEKPQNHRSHQSNPLEKKPSAEPGRRKTATASWKPLAPMTKSWQPKELPGEDEGAGGGLWLFNFLRMVIGIRLLVSKYILGSPLLGGNDPIWGAEFS